MCDTESIECSFVSLRIDVLDALVRDADLHILKCPGRIPQIVPPALQVHMNQVVETQAQEDQGTQYHF